MNSFRKAEKKWGTFSEFVFAVLKIMGQNCTWSGQEHDEVNQTVTIYICLGNIKQHMICESGRIC